MTTRDEVLYKAYRGSKEAGVLLIVEPMDGQRLIFKLLELRQKKRETMLVSFVETEKLKAMYKSLLSGSFDEFYPEGFKEWGASERTHCISKDGPLVSMGAELRMFVFQRHQEKEGHYTVRLACFEKLARGKPVLLKSLGVPLTGREAIEMLETLTEVKGRVPEPMAPVAQTLMKVEQRERPRIKRRNLRTSRQAQRVSSVGVGMIKSPKSTRKTTSTTKKRLAVVKERPSVVIKERGPVHPGVSVDEELVIEENIMRPDGQKPKATEGDVYDEIAELEVTATKMMEENANEDEDIITSPLQIVQMFVRQPYALHQRRAEEMHLVWLDSHGRVIETQRYPNVPKIVKTPMGFRQVFGLRPMDIVQMVPQGGASAVILVHNHPAEYLPRPSQDDILVTVKIDDVCKRAGIKLFDHLIIGMGGWYTYALNQRHEGFGFKSRR